MTGSTHLYEAFVQGTPDVALPLSEDAGTITFDSTTAPYVQASLRLGKIDSATLELLDTRQSPIPRVTITADATYPGDTQARTFDLNVRGWERDQATGEPMLRVASDEAILEDVRALVDDNGAFTYQSSLRGVVNYVLGSCIPGAALEATPTDDADVTTYSDSVNIVANGAAIVDTSGWSLVGSGSLARQTGATWAANSSDTAFRIYGSGSGTGGYIQLAYYDAASLFGGKKFMFRARQKNSAGVNVGVAGASAGDMKVLWSLDDGTGSFYSDDSMGDRSANGQKDHRLNVNFPENTKTVLIRLYHGFTSADSVFWSDVRASERSLDPTDDEYFDGNTSNTATYEYIWQELNGLSYTTRTAMVDRTPDSLLWEAGRTALEFLRPIVQAAGLRLVCNELREWTLRNADYEAAGSTAIEYGGTGLLRLYAGTEAISREDDVWCDACVVRYKGGRVDWYALTDPPSRVRYIDRTNDPWPGIGFAQHVVTRANNQSRDVTATVVANWDTTADQPVTFELFESPSLAGKIERVEFNLSSDEMTVGARVVEV